MCTSCPLGTSSSNPGAQSITACTPCQPGTSASTVGTASCKPCDPGSYSNSSGSSSCSFCPKGKYLPFDGKTSVGDCIPCDQGTTLTVGASSASDCIVTQYRCAFGTMPVSRALPSGANDCIPISCPPHLTLTQSGCVGCPFGTAGAHPGCVNCTLAALATPATASGGAGGNPILAQTQCPGFLPVAIPADPSTLGLPAGTPNPPPSSLLSDTTNAVSAFPATLTAPPATYSFFAGSSLLTGLSGAGLALATLLTAFLASFHGWFNTAVGGMLRAADMFSMDHAVRKEGEAALKRTTALGGGCTLLMILSFATSAALLTLRRATDNTLSTNSIIAITSMQSNVAALPWVPAPPTNPSRGGLNINIFSLASLGGGGSCATPLSFTPSGMGGGGSGGGTWVTQSTPSTPDGRSVLTLSCQGCLLTSTTTLQLTLPASCQALYLEATSVDARGTLRSLPLDPAVSSPQGLNLVSSIAWNLDVMLGVLLDQTDSAEGGGKSARGYLLLSSAGSKTTAYPGSSILPTSSAILVSISLSLQPIFTQTVLTQKTSLADLGASIIGLAGLAALFRLLFQYTEKLMEGQLFVFVCGGCCRGGGGGGDSARVLKGEGLGEGGDGVGEAAASTAVLKGAKPPKKVVAVAHPEELVVNPLHHHHHHQHHHHHSIGVVPEEGKVVMVDPPLPTHPSVWHRHSDGDDVWFHCPATGEVAWKLPPGADLQDRVKRK